MKRHTASLGPCGRQAQSVGASVDILAHKISPVSRAHLLFSRFYLSGQSGCGYGVAGGLPPNAVHLPLFANLLSIVRRGILVERLPTAFLVYRSAFANIHS